MGPWPPAMYRQHAPIDRQDTRWLVSTSIAHFALCFAIVLFSFPPPPLHWARLRALGLTLLDLTSFGRMSSISRHKLATHKNPTRYVNALVIFLSNKIENMKWCSEMKHSKHARHHCGYSAPASHLGGFRLTSATTTATPAYWAAPQQATSLLRQLQAEAPAIPSIQALTEAMGRPHGFPPPL